MAVTISTNGSMSYSVLSQLDDPTTQPVTHKWLAANNNELDGSYNPMSSVGAAVIGWWGTELSDSNGEFITNPSASVSHSPGESRTVHSLRVIGDAMYNEYPVDFDVKFYTTGGVLLDTVTATANTLVEYEAFFTTPLFDVTFYSIEIYKWSASNAVVKLSNLSTPFIIKREDTFVTVLYDFYTQLNPTSFYKSSADTLKMVSDIDDSDPSMVISLSTTDELELSADALDEEKHITVNLSDEDSLELNLVEDTLMTNIYTVCDAPVRQIFGRVEVTYTDPYKDETLQISTNGTGRNTDPYELADNISTSSYKWLSLHDNVLDGSFHPMPSNKEVSVGWWGDVLSDSSGYITPEPVVTIEFSARALTALKVCGDNLLNCFPVDFEFKAYDISDTLLHTRSVTGNTLVDWTESVTGVLNVSKLELTIFRINKPNSVVKLTEMFTAITELYEAEQIESISLLEEIGYNTGSLPIGNISANEIDIGLANNDRHFDLNNMQSTLYGYIKRNRRVRAWLGAYVGPEIEWHLLGVFWTTSWDISRDSLVASLTARDRLELLRLTDFNSSMLYVNYTLYQLFELILVDAGLESVDYMLDADLTTVTIPYAWFGKMSHRDALNRLASCAVIQVFCNKEGVIRVNINLDATPETMVTFDDDINVYSSRYPLAVSEQVNYIEVTSINWSLSTTQTLYEADESLTLAPGEEVTVDYEFNRIPVVSIDAPIITGDSGVVVTGVVVRAWGAVITYSNPTGSSKNVTKVKVTGKVLENIGQQTSIAKDDQLIREDGKIKVSLSHEFIQTSAYAQSLANEILNTYGTARHDVTLENRGQIALRLGDKVDVNDFHQNNSTTYMTSRQHITWNGVLSVTTEGKKL